MRKNKRLYYHTKKKKKKISSQTKTRKYLSSSHQRHPHRRHLTWRSENSLIWKGTTQFSKMGRQVGEWAAQVLEIKRQNKYVQVLCLSTWSVRTDKFPFTIRTRIIRYLGTYLIKDKCDLSAEIVQCYCRR